MRQGIFNFFFKKRLCDSPHWSKCFSSVVFIRLFSNLWKKRCCSSWENLKSDEERHLSAECYPWGNCVHFERCVLQPTNTELLEGSRKAWIKRCVGTTNLSDVLFRNAPSPWKYHTYHLCSTSWPSKALTVCCFHNSYSNFVTGITMLLFPYWGWWVQNCTLMACLKLPSELMTGRWDFEQGVFLDDS